MLEQDKIYSDYPQIPYISPERDMEKWKKEGTKVPKRNMEPLADGLLAGDIILLWLISLGTFTTERSFPKYFEYRYGIEAKSHLEMLQMRGYIYIETAFDSLNHVNAAAKRSILKEYSVAGLSKMKVEELNHALKSQLTEQALGEFISVRGVALTEKGQQTLQRYQEIVDRHPKKSF